MDDGGAKPFAQLPQTPHRSAETMLGTEGASDNGDSGFSACIDERSLRRKHHDAPPGDSATRGVDHVARNATEVADWDDPQCQWIDGISLIRLGVTHRSAASRGDCLR